MFAIDGGLDSFVRIPYSRPVSDLRDAVDRLAEAWSSVITETGDRETRPARVMVA